ncbi:hypothetical protein AHAS_Ahas18G0240000 [Arachis hypogaea]
MKTEAITEYWFGEEAEESDRRGGQCGHGDDRTEKEGDDLLSRFMGSSKTTST